MSAHPPNNVCRFGKHCWEWVVKVRQDTPYRRLATNGGEKCGLAFLIVTISYVSVEIQCTLTTHTELASSAATIVTLRLIAIATSRTYGSLDQVQRRLRATVLPGALEFGVVLERPAKDTVSGFLIVHVNSKFSIYFN
jgi:hypothetical protein